MLKVDSDFNIIYSHGDTFAVQFDLGDYSLKDGDTATLSISHEGELMLDTTIQGKGQSILEFAVSADDMKQLPLGRMQYDVVIRFADGREYTTDFIRQIMVVPTAH